MPPEHAEHAEPAEPHHSPVLERMEATEKVNGTFESVNKMNRLFDVTPGMQVAHTMEDMNEVDAGLFSEHAVEGMRGPLNAVMENPYVAGAGGVLGLGLGGYNTAKGVSEMFTAGERGQGAMDTVSGLSGMAAGGAALGGAVLGEAGLAATLGPLAAACPFLAPAALAAGLAASGNEKVAEWGWLGKGEDGKNRSGTDFIAEETSNAYDWAHDGLGGGVLGTVGGGLAGAGMAIGSGVVGIGTDIAAGAVGLGETIGSGIGAIGGGIASGVSSLFSW